jgi:hypothetical protein
MLGRLPAKGEEARLEIVAAESTQGFFGLGSGEWARTGWTQ